LELPVRTVILDGEALAVRPDGRPLPFQATAARGASQGEGARVQLTPFFFDCLHLDGADLTGSPAAERRAALERVVPRALLVPRDPENGGFVMLGKTFKGMTYELLAWQTQRFKELQIEDNGWVVTVRPEQVVEIAFDGVQRSPRYPGGMALRFARVLRYRED